MGENTVSEKEYERLEFTKIVKNWNGSLQRDEQNKRK